MVHGALFLFTLAGGHLHGATGSMVLDSSQGLRRWGLCTEGVRDPFFLKSVARDLHDAPQNIPVELTDQQHWVSAALLIPLACASIVAWQTEWSQPITLSTHDGILLFMFMVVCASSRLAMHETAGSPVLATLAACFVLNAAKGFLSFVLLVMKQAMSFGDILKVLRQKGGEDHFPAWCRIACVAILRCSNEALALFVLQLLSPLTFQLLAHCTIVAIVPLQWLFLGKQLSALQVLSVFLLVVGGSALCLGESNALGSAIDHRSNFMLGLALMFLKIMTAASALVLNEKTLKEIPLTVDANNLVSYCLSMTALVAVMISWALGMSSTAATIHRDMGFAFIEVFTNPWMAASVILFAVYGIMVTYLLKARSALEKELASVGVVAMLAVKPAAGLYSANDGLATHTIECALIIIVCCVTYIMNEPAKPAKLTALEKA